ncbi:PQQ-binding-like beta-propeller repeat protein [Streptomyces anulatus]|uniref:caspase, EACC1-associated type n=1 Tax=Streptomyces anulatus TaxID=1892 RepID=UPI0022513E81|nr:PQQ-binding-like beta-propeller repeat protein [Streptomyces anulatus]MCX4520926.1 PQQ-binding-like beta-propeller repeat protein [Streptomyces anulatus]MCX4603796.1 PQQ-binding-like beta-propeller repeat protein [Streptomyces anulatus]
MTAQPFGDGNRGALLIGTGTYDHPELPELRSPEVDCTRLDALLRDPRIGAFEVQTLIDADRATLERAIGEFFDSAWGHDVRLLYLSGHGILSRSDKLHFAIRQTDPARPAYTTISAAFIHEVMEECRARSIVVVLDCCYSGLFLPGAKGNESARLEEALGGHGRVVITAGTRSQRAWEGQHLDAENPAPSLFTGMLIEGISSGAADLNGDGVVTLQELYRFACERLHQEGVTQTPRMGGEMQYDIPLAKVRKQRKLRSSRTDRTGGRNRSSSEPSARRKPEPWQTRAAFGPARQPILSDGMLVVHEPYRLHAIDLESRQRSPLIKMWYPSSPALHGGAAYFPGKGGHLQMTDLRTGKHRASHPVAIRGDLLSISKDVLYATAQDGTLHAFDPSTLHLLWSLPSNGLAVASAPQAAAGYTIFTAAESRMSGDAATVIADRIMAISEGRVVWSYKTEAPLSPDWAVTDHGIYVTLQPEEFRSNQRIVAVSPENGKLLWSFETRAHLAASLVATDEALIFGDTGNRLVALDAKTGTFRWNREKKTEGCLLTRPSISGDALFTADRAAKLVRWNLLTGRKVRACDLLVGPDRQGSPAILNGVVYATDARGDIHALPM